MGGSDGAEDTDGQSWAGEGTSAYEVRGDAQQSAESAHFFLEEVAQRLDELQLRVLEQAADVVVRLDRRRGAL